MKRNNKLSLLALILVLCLCLPLLAACGGRQGNDTTDSLLQVTTEEQTLAKTEESAEKTPTEETSENVTEYTEGLVFTLNNSGTEYSVTDYTGIANEVVIPATYKGLPVTSIGFYAFEDCTSLASITIPDSVTRIGGGAFSGCTNLTYNEYDNAYYLGNQYNPYVVLKKAKNTDITSCIINENTKVIYSSAFSDCESFTSITIPDSITSIGDWAFYGCYSLASVVFSENSQLTGIGHLAFSYCTSLESITIPESVMGIGGSAFSWCESLASVVFSENSQLTSIGEHAFSNCDSLASITIPESVTSIGDEAFYKCDSLICINVDENNANYKDIDGNLYSKDGTVLIQYAIGKTDTSFAIPESVTSIGYAAFSDCDSLASITIPESVTSIGDGAFYNCTSLESITIPNNVTSIGEWAFKYCESLATVNYTGTEEQWNEIAIASGNDYLKNANINYNYVPEE